MYKRMLVPLDGSKLAEETIPYAQEVAGRLDLDLDLLHVTNPLESEGLGLSFMSQFYMDKIAESVREQIQKIQATTIGQESVKPIEVSSKVVSGYPADEILKYAEGNSTDVILMATHGASGVRRWEIGSMAYKILQASKIPVLLIRSDCPRKRFMANGLSKLF